MAVTPIDLQANLGHMHDVAKSTQAKNEAVVTAHLHEDQKAEDGSNKQKDTVSKSDQSEQGNFKTIGNDQKEPGGKQQHKKKQKDAEKLENDRSIKQMQDPSLGKNIDFTR